MKFLTNIYVLKALTLLFWVISGSLLWNGHTGILSWIPQLAIILVGVHVLEVLIFWFFMREKKHSPAFRCSADFHFWGVSHA